MKTHCKNQRKACVVLRFMKVCQRKVKFPFGRRSQMPSPREAAPATQQDFDVSLKETDL